MNQQYEFAAIFILVFFVLGILNGSKLGINIKGKSGASGVILFFFFLGLIALLYFM